MFDYDWQKVSIVYYAHSYSVFCDDLPDISNGDILYSPPRGVSAFLPANVRYIGTIAEYSCSPGYLLENGSPQRACQLDMANGTWNGTEPMCEGRFPLKIYTTRIVLS